MDFSQAWDHSGIFSISPDGESIALAQDTRLLILDVESLQERSSFQFEKKVGLVEWASNSTNILCASFSEARVKAWSIANPDWECTIKESPVCGMVHARWAPDGNHIITISDFHLRLTVWSVLSSNQIQFEWPKLPSRGLTFSPDGEYMAVATRHNGQDEIIVVSCTTWDTLRSFPPDSNDVADLAWSPDGCGIAIWNSPLDYKLLVHSPEGRRLFQHEAYSVGLGIKSAAWSKNGQFLAVGSIADQTVRVFHSLSWSCVANLKHLPSVDSPVDLCVFKETELTVDLANDIYGQNMASNPVQAKYDILPLPVMLPSVKPSVDKPNPKQGIGLLSWSFDDKYFLTRCDSCPTCLWVWEAASMALCTVLVQRQPIKAAVWSPVACQLALCTGSGTVFLWSEDGASCVALPHELSEIAIVDLSWSSTGRCLALSSRTLLCCAFFDLDCPPSTPS